MESGIYFSGESKESPKLWEVLSTIVMRCFYSLHINLACSTRLLTFCIHAALDRSKRVQTHFLLVGGGDWMWTEGCNIPCILHLLTPLVKMCQKFQSTLIFCIYLFILFFAVLESHSESFRRIQPLIWEHFPERLKNLT